MHSFSNHILSLSLSPSLTHRHTLSPHNVYKETHNLPKTTNRATATANQDQCNNSQGKPTRIVMVEGYSLRLQNKLRNEKKKIEIKGLLSIAAAANPPVVIAISFFKFPDSHVMIWHE